MSAFAKGKNEEQVLQEMDLDAIYLALGQKVLPLPRAAGGTVRPQQESLVATLVTNMLSTGFAPTSNLIQNWLGAEPDTFTQFGKQLMSSLQKMVGNDVVHEPMYPNFPKQVMEVDDAELIVNALLHYFGDWAGVRIMPAYDKLIRPVLPSSEAILKSIELGSAEDFKSATTTLLLSSQAFSSAQRTVISSLFAHATKQDENGRLAYSSLWESMPREFVNKENLAFVAGLVLSTFAGRPEFDQFDYKSKFKTATDVLRLAVAFSGGDVSLAETPRFTSFTRPQRKILMALLDAATNPIEDMWTRREVFKRLGEKIHPREYARKHPVAADAFAAVRNPQAKYATVASRLEEVIHRNPDFDEALSLLCSRPGVFARRLNELLTAFPGKEIEIAKAWETVVWDVSTTVLLQVHAYFKARAAKDGYIPLPGSLPPRMFIPKGQTTHPIVVPDERKRHQVVISKRIYGSAHLALARRFAKLDKLGNVYVDPALAEIRIPFGVRSASKSLQTVGRGSALPMGEGSTLRFFIHWKDQDSAPDPRLNSVPWASSGRVDIDLSASLMSEDFGYMGAVAYYRLRDSVRQAYHSGDITSAPNGASEFLDVDIESMLASGARYVAMNVHSYTRQPFKDVPECFAGYMMRSEVDSGEVYEPSTVANKVDLTNNGSVATVFLFDLKERKAIWVDMALKMQDMYAPNNDYYTSKQSVSVAEALVNTSTANLYDLFSIHGRARGRLVESPELADVVFSLDGDVTPFDTERILGEFVV